MRLSPSGARYALVAVSGGQKRVVIVSAADSSLVASYNVGQSKIRDLSWAGDDHLLITYSATVDLGVDFQGYKDELYATLAVNLSTQKAFSVFMHGNSGRVAKAVVGLYGVSRIDGRWYGYFGGYTYENGRLNTDDDNRIYPDLYRVDLDTGMFTLAAHGDGDLRDWMVSPAGAVLARSYYSEANGAWRIKSGARGGATLAEGVDPFGGASILGFGKSADQLLLETPTTDGDVEKVVPVAGGAPVKVADTETVAEELVDPVTHLWIGTTREDDRRSLILFDPLKQARLNGAYKAFTGYIPHLVSYSADFSRLIIRCEGGDDSGSYWIVNFGDKAGNAQEIGADYPTVTPAFVGPVRTIDYKATDGLALHGVLTLPPGRSPVNLPVVVMPHGGPVDRDYPGFDYWAQVFASRGYAVFQPNFRGSSGYGLSLIQAAYGEWGRKMQTDISDGLTELVRQGLVDPKRACIVGWSYGGYAALAGVTVQQGLYRCAVSMAGVSDLGRSLNFVRDEAGGQSASVRFWKQLMGVTTDWSDAQVSDVSPTKLAAQADAPILLIHGDDDTVVPIEQSRVMAKALKAAGRPVEVLTLPGADHWLLEEDARMAMLKASVAFVLRNNPPDPAPAAVDAK